jgi:type I restriction-modification system DNA methylase subunit
MPTEMTIRNFLLKELEKRGVKVNTEISYTTPIGRLMPDMLLHNGAQYVVETKLGLEAKLLDAMVRLYDYSKHTPVKGAFAVLFPQELRQPWNIEILEKIAGDPKLEYVATAVFKDLRPSQRFAGNLTQIADWMASQVLRPLVVEADTSFAIKVLTEAVTSITASVKRLRETELEDIFGGKTVFENILQYEEGRYPLEEMRQAATYLLVNQIIFYHVLSRMDVTLKEMDEDKIGKPNDLLRYFEPVLERDYSSVFGFDVASRLPESATEIVKRVIMTVKALAPEKIGQDVLGKVFHELIPFNIRKAVAAFYTNNEAAEILAQLSIDESDAKVIDLAVGSGTLLVAAYRRKRELLRTGRGGISLEDHKRFLEHDLTGIDIMPFAAHLAVMHLSLQALLHETEKVRIAVWDSTELKPDMTIPAICSELKAAYRRPTLDMFKEGAITPREAYIKKGAITLEGVGGEEIPLEKADVVIMNPPFTRQERLPKEYKDALNTRLKEYQDKLHGRLGLYGYFVFLADRFLKLGGKLALVLPATILRIVSTQGIRDLLMDNYQFEYIITTYQRAAFSEGAQFREILFVGRKKQEVNKQPCTVTFLKNLPKDMMAARELADKLRTLKSRLNVGETHDSIDLAVRNISQRELRKHVENLFKFIACEDLRLPDIWDKVREEAHEKLVPFSKALTKLGDEIEEGARARSHLLRAPIGSMFIVCTPDRAIKRHDLWVARDMTKKTLTAEDLIEHRKISIPTKSLWHGLRRFSGVGTIDLSDKLDFIVVKKFPQIEDFFWLENVDYILNDLPKWRKYIKQRLSKLAVACRFDMSATGTNLFAWYSKIPMAGYSLVLNVTGLDDEDAKIFALWFNSTIHVLQLFLNRIETRGAWMAFRKYVMSDLFVIHPSKLSKSQKKAILKTFEGVKDVEFPSFLKQLKDRFPARVAIDKTVLKVLGFSDDEIDRILDYLYPALANEIEQLKTLMAG